ncbi:hypothetical protein V8B97DRAFT_2106698 [Scleroderma yunnanense]
MTTFLQILSLPRHNYQSRRSGTRISSNQHFLTVISILFCFFCFFFSKSISQPTPANMRRRIDLEPFSKLGQTTITLSTVGGIPDGCEVCIQLNNKNPQGWDKNYVPTPTSRGDALCASCTGHIQPSLYPGTDVKSSTGFCTLECQVHFWTLLCDPTYLCSTSGAVIPVLIVILKAEYLPLFRFDTNDSAKNYASVTPYTDHM